MLPSPNPKTDPVTDAAAAAELEAKQKAAAPLDEASPSAKFLRSVIAVEVKKPDPKPKKEGDEGPAQKPPAKKKSAPPPAPAPAIDENKLGAAIGRSLAEHSKSDAREKPQGDDAEKPKLSAKEDADTRRMAVLARMEVINPERYKGLAGRYKANQAALRERATAWETANPGERYGDMLEAYEADPDSHAEFADEAKVANRLEAESDYDDEDYDDARAAIRDDQRDEKNLKEKLAPLEAKLDERLTEIEMAEKARNSSRQIAEVAYAAGNDCWKALGEEFADVVRKDGSINVEALSEINKADPVKHDIAVAAAKTAEVGAAKIHMLANGLEKWNPNNHQHVAISNFAHDQEQRMLARPAEEQIAEDGRRFATKEQWTKMSPEQRERHFIFTEGDLKALWVHDVAKRAKADLQAEDDKFSRRAKARGLIRDEEETTVRTPRRPSTRIDQRDEEANDLGEDDSGKPMSPAFSLSPKLAAGKGGRGNGSENGATRFVTKLIG